MTLRGHTIFHDDRRTEIPFTIWKVRLFEPWLCTAGATFPQPVLQRTLTVVFTSMETHTVHSPSVSFHCWCWCLHPAWNHCLLLWVPLLSARFPRWALFGNINHTNLPFELHDDDKQKTSPRGKNLRKPSTGAEFDASRLLGLTDHVMLFLSGTDLSLQTGLCSLQLGHFWWHEDITQVHHSVWR